MLARLPRSATDRMPRRTRLMANRVILKDLRLRILLASVLNSLPSVTLLPMAKEFRPKAMLVAWHTHKAMDRSVIRAAILTLPTANSTHNVSHLLVPPRPREMY